MEKKHDRLEASVKHGEIETTSVKETLKTHHQVHESLNTKIKDVNESVYTIENVQLQTINTKLMQTATVDQLAAVKKEMDEQVKFKFIVPTLCFYPKVVADKIIYLGL